MAKPKPDWQKAAELVRDAGGRIVGRTKLQKVAYLLELAGLGEGFHFEYRHYGPFSEDLADAIQMASAFGLVSEDERKADWGGVYSIYSAPGDPVNPTRAAFAQIAVQMDAVELELAATAAYLYAIEGYADPWKETARRKPEKAKRDRLRAAINAYRELQDARVPNRLPRIA